jgi:hypothetical protein
VLRAAAALFHGAIDRVFPQPAARHVDRVLPLTFGWATRWVICSAFCSSNFLAIGSTTYSISPAEER